MKILFLLSLLISSSSYAGTSDFCIGRIVGPSGYSSIAGAFAYDFWCSNGLYKKYSDYGCYTERCHDQYRQGLEKIQIPALGYKLIAETKSGPFEERYFVYASVWNPVNDGSIYGFAHKITQHTGFKTNSDRTTVYVSKNGRSYSVDFGGLESPGYLDNEFKDYDLVRKISRDTPRQQLSEFHIYRKK